MFTNKTQTVTYILQSLRICLNPEEALSFCWEVDWHMKYPALIWGCLSGSLESVHQFCYMTSVFKGKDMNSRNTYIKDILVGEYGSDHKLTPLIAATYSGNKNLVKYIMKFEAPINHVVNGLTATKIASALGNVELVTLFVNAGAVISDDIRDYIINSTVSTENIVFVCFN
jgi:hypothetical protein